MSKTDTSSTGSYQIKGKGHPTKTDDSLGTLPKGGGGGGGGGVKNCLLQNQPCFDSHQYNC